MYECQIVIKCRSTDESDKISDLIQRNRRLEEQVHKAVLGGPLNLTDSDIVVDALHANISTMHAVIRILKEKAG